MAFKLFISPLSEETNLYNKVVAFLSSEQSTILFSSKVVFKYFLCCEVRYRMKFIIVCQFH